MAHIPWDGLWNDCLSLPDHPREEGVAVQRCYHNEQLCLHYQVTVLISCGSADTPVSAQAGKCPADPYSKSLVQLLATLSLSLWEVASNSQAVFAGCSEEETAPIKSQGIK